MTRWIPVLALPLALAVGTPAQARPVVLMECDELIETLLFDPVKDRREDAAEGVGKKSCATGVAALVDASFHDPHREVRMTAVWALEDLDDLAVPEARDGLQRIFASGGVGDTARLTAMKVLAKRDPTRLDRVLPEALSGYRSMAPALARAVIERAGEAGRPELADALLFVVLDAQADPRVRLAALGSAERYEPPRLFQAYLALLDSEDRMVRARCLDGLARVGGPSAEVAPVMERMAASDSSGDLRGRAMAALSHHAHSGLLPLVHETLLGEKNLVAWAHALNLLEVLADGTSVPVVALILDEQGNYLLEETTERLVRILVRIGDPAARPMLEAVAADGTHPRAQAVACRGLELMNEGSDARSAWLSGFPTRARVTLWDPTTPAESPAPLAVTLGDDGRLDGLMEAPEACSGELRVSGFGDGGVELQIDGFVRASTGDGEGDERTFALSEGHHYLRAVELPRRITRSSSVLTMSCGQTAVGGVTGERGLMIYLDDLKGESESGLTGPAVPAGQAPSNAAVRRDAPAADSPAPGGVVESESE